MSTRAEGMNTTSEEEGRVLHSLRKVHCLALNLNVKHSTSSPEGALHIWHVRMKPANHLTYTNMSIWNRMASSAEQIFSGLLFWNTV
eukprot:jgi/Botrbrau1/20660/Bobra.0779s0001.1